MLARLDDAEGWGTWDLVGGGLISGMAKHSCLDDAQELVPRLQTELRRFQSELGDVDMDAGELDISADGFLRFADLFAAITREEAQDLIARWVTPERTALAVIRPKGEVQ